MRIHLFAMALAVSACPPPPQPCVPVTEVCDDAADNDCDGQTDCADTDCGGAACIPENIDAGCWKSAACDSASGTCRPELEREVCDDGADNDCDGRIDCADDGCLGSRCVAQGVHAGCVESATCARSGTCQPVVSVGKPCSLAGTCREAQTCNAAGACVGGFAAPDGLLCLNAGCMTSECVSGACGASTDCSRECRASSLCVPHKSGSFCQSTLLANGSPCSRGVCFFGDCLAHLRQTTQTSATFEGAAGSVVVSSAVIGINSGAMVEADGGAEITFTLPLASLNWRLSLPQSARPGNHSLTTSDGGGPFVTVESSVPTNPGTFESIGGTITLVQVDMRYGGGNVQGSIHAVLSGGDSRTLDAGLDATFFAEFR